jgi:uncharacterized protein
MPQNRHWLRSDREGLLHPDACERLAGVDHIIHAGDIGRPEVIAGSRELAPTTAIRGTSTRAGGRRATPILPRQRS